MNIKILFARYWWFIALLAVAAYFLISNIGAEKAREREMVFSVQSLEDITKIVLSDNNSDLILEQLDGKWVVIGDFVANPDAVDALFRVLTRVQATSPVPMAVNDSIVREVRKEGLLVEVFSKRKRLKSYRVFSTSTFNLNAIGLLMGSKVAYKLHLPNFDGNIVELFKTNPVYWQSNQFAVPSLGAIDAVEVEIPQDLENSFRIDVDKEAFRLFALYYGVSAKQFDTLRVERYLQSLLNLSYREVVTNLSAQEKAAVIYSEPDFIITINIKDGKKYQLKIFPIPIDEYIDELGRPVRFDLNRLYASQSEDSSIYIVNYIDVHTALRNLSFFNPIFN